MQERINAYAFPSVMVALVIDTVPPDAIVELKLRDPEPTAASISRMTVPTPPEAAVLNRADAGVPEARPVSLVIAENVRTPAVAPGRPGSRAAATRASCRGRR